MKSLCSHSNQIAIRFIYDKLPPRPEYNRFSLVNLEFLSFVDRFRVTSSTSRADLLCRTHPVRLSGTVIASSAVLPYMYVSFVKF